MLDTLQGYAVGLGLPHFTIGNIRTYTDALSCKRWGVCVSTILSAECSLNTIPNIQKAGPRLRGHSDCLEGTLTAGAQRRQRRETSPRPAGHQGGRTIPCEHRQHAIACGWAVPAPEREPMKTNWRDMRGQGLKVKQVYYKTNEPRKRKWSLERHHQYMLKKMFGK